MPRPHPDRPARPAPPAARTKAARLLAGAWLAIATVVTFAAPVALIGYSASLVIQDVGWLGFLAGIAAMIVGLVVCTAVAVLALSAIVGVHEWAVRTWEDTAP